TDITPKKQREVELISARDAAQQALRDLELAQERLVQSEKMASLGQLTAGIAHEIKNPLNFVNNFAKLSQELLEELNEIIEAPLAALAQDPREDAEELLGLLTSNLGKIDQHGRRADSIVKNMLLHSRDGPSISQSVDLNGLVDEALNLAYHGLRAENPNLNVELIKNFSAEVGQVECFPQDLMRVFLNLMSNGIYASNQRYLQIDVSQPNASPDTFSPTLIVTTMTLNDQITIEVTDNGVGISDDIRDKLFLPFFTTKPAGEGTGLGLSLSYDIVVKQHGGELSVESQLGDYATFKVTLPCSLPKDINTPGGEE
ncbi:MAG: signal transduction histidine kinase, partial [Gammaproteobacteria bacterium]